MGLLDGKIAKQVAKAMQRAKLTKPAVLVKVTNGARGSTVSAGPAVVESMHACQGFVDGYDATDIDGTNTLADDRRVTLLGASIAGGAVPAVGDKVQIEGLTLKVIHVQRDAAAATYTLLARK